MRFDPRHRRLALDPRDPAFFADPYAAYARLHAAPGPVFWEDYGFWCFFGHAAVSALLRDKRFGRQILHVATRQELGWRPRPGHLADFDAIERHSLLELEPPEHTRLRALVNRAFVSRQVERLAPAIAALAERLVDRLAPGDDLIAGLATPLPVGVIAALIGAPAEDAARLLDWSHKMVAMYRFAPTRADEDEAAAAAREFAAYVRDLVRERRRERRDDLICELIAAESEQGRLSEDELVSTVILLLNAGHEATVHALGNAVKALLEGGARFGGSEGAVEELLRFDSPLHMFTRYALRDVEIEGVRLRKGERVGLLLGAANRDPAVFADPGRLDLARAPNPHVAFGAGIHFCVGAPLARREMRIALEVLFRRLPGLELAEPPSYRDAYHFHGLTALKVCW
ncbi:MAG TPA: cytochrome P450 [Roseiarcus sp.]|nr:cytochrome P450 [Roseiarcus sp.]